MKKASVLTAILIVLTIPSIASAQARYVTFTDSEGKEHQHELADDSRVRTRRPDGSTEAIIAYKNSALEQVNTYRPDGNIEMSSAYNEGLFRVRTWRPDQSVEVDARYQSVEVSGLYVGRLLRSIATRRPDGSDEVKIGYENGQLEAVRTIRPSDNGGNNGVTYENIDAIIFQENGRLSQIQTRRPDQGVEALIEYEDGRILNLSVADPDQTGVSDGEIRDVGIRAWREEEIRVGNANWIFNNPDDQTETGVPYGKLRVERQITFRNGYPVCQ